MHWWAQGRGAQRPQTGFWTLCRRESLDAWHQAQKLQAVLQELLLWAQRLQAEMGGRSTPSSPAEAQRMLNEHQELKVSGRTGAFPSLCPFPYGDPDFPFSPFLPLPSSTPPPQLSFHWAASLPLSLSLRI